jgi:hypothetical protein
MGYQTTLQGKFAHKVGDPVPEFNSEYVYIEKWSGGEYTDLLLVIQYIQLLYISQSLSTSWLGAWTSFTP